MLGWPDNCAGFCAGFRFLRPLSHKMLIFKMKLGLLGASWGFLGVQVAAKMGPSWAQDGPSCDQVGVKLAS